LIVLLQHWRPVTDERHMVDLSKHVLPPVVDNEASIIRRSCPGVKLGEEGGIFNS
jgi:hypothetical protein